MKRILMSLGLLMALSVSLCLFLSAAAVTVIAFSLLIASLIIMALSFKDKDRLRLLFITVPIALFIAYFGLFYNINVAPKLALVGQNAKIYAQVCDIPTEREDYTIYKVKVKSSDNKNVKSGLKITCFSFEKDSIEMYDYISADIEFQPLDKEFRLYNYSNGIYLSAKTKNFAFEDSGKSKCFVMQGLYNLRKNIKTFISRNTDGDAIGVLEALTIGDGSGITTKTSNEFRICGLTHMLVISGFHLSLIFLGLFKLLRKLGVPQRVSAWICLVLSFLFTALVGFNLSVVRAFIAFAIVMLGYIRLQCPDGLNSLGGAALIILFANPYSIGDVGFLLSVSSLLGIIIAAEPLCERLRVKTEYFCFNLIANNIISIFIQSLCAVIFVFPVMILFFTAFSVMAPVINVIAFLPITVITVLGLVSVLFGLIPFLSFIGEWLIALCEILTDLTLKLISFIAKFDFISVNIKFSSVYIPLAVIFIVIGISVIIFKENFRTVFAVFLGFCVVLSFAVNAVSVPNKSIAFVGGTKCSVVIDNSDCVVIGTCKDYGEYKTLYEYLNDNNIRKINAVVILENSPEFAGGLEYIKSDFNCEKVVTVPSVEKENEVGSGKGDIRITLSPEFILETHKNFDSYALKLNFYGKTALYSYGNINISKYANTFKGLDLFVTNTGTYGNSFDEKTVCVANRVEKGENKVYNCNRILMDGNIIYCNILDGLTFYEY